MSTAAASIGQCPICQRSFPQTELQMHVNLCLDSGGGFPSYDTAAQSRVDRISPVAAPVSKVTGQRPTGVRSRMISRLIREGDVVVRGPNWTGGDDDGFPAHVTISDPSWFMHAPIGDVLQTGTIGHSRDHLVPNRIPRAVKIQWRGTRRVNTYAFDATSASPSASQPGTTRPRSDWFARSSLVPERARMSLLRGDRTYAVVPLQWVGPGWLEHPAVKAGQVTHEGRKPADLGIGTGIHPVRGARDKSSFNTVSDSSAFQSARGQAARRSRSSRSKYWSAKGQESSWELPKPALLFARIVAVRGIDTPVLAPNRWGQAAMQVAGMHVHTATVGASDAKHMQSHARAGRTGFDFTASDPQHTWMLPFRASTELLLRARAGAWGGLWQSNLYARVTLGAVLRAAQSQAMEIPGVHQEWIGMQAAVPELQSMPVQVSTIDTGMGAAQAAGTNSATRGLTGLSFGLDSKHEEGRPRDGDGDGKGSDSSSDSPLVPEGLRSRSESAQSSTVTHTGNSAGAFGSMCRPREVISDGSFALLSPRQKQRIRSLVALQLSMLTSGYAAEKATGKMPAIEDRNLPFFSAPPRQAVLEALGLSRAAERNQRKAQVHLEAAQRAAKDAAVLRLQGCACSAPPVRAASADNPGPSSGSQRSGDYQMADGAGRGRRPNSKAAIALEMMGFNHPEIMHYSQNSQVAVRAWSSPERPNGLTSDPFLLDAWIPLRSSRSGSIGRLDGTGEPMDAHQFYGVEGVSAQQLLNSRVCGNGYPTGPAIRVQIRFLPTSDASSAPMGPLSSRPLLYACQGGQHSLLRAMMQLLVSDSERGGLSPQHQSVVMDRALRDNIAKSISTEVGYMRSGRSSGREHGHYEPNITMEQRMRSLANDLGCFSEAASACRFSGESQMDERSAFDKGPGAPVIPLMSHSHFRHGNYDDTKLDPVIHNNGSLKQFMLDVVLARRSDGLGAADLAALGGSPSHFACLAQLPYSCYSVSAVEKPAKDPSTEVKVGRRSVFASSGTKFPVGAELDKLSDALRGMLDDGRGAHTGSSEPAEPRLLLGCNSRSTLHLAASGGNPSSVYLVSHILPGTQLGMDGVGTSPLHLAVLHGNVPAAAALLGPPPAEASASGSSSLMSFRATAAAAFDQRGAEAVAPATLGAFRSRNIQATRVFGPSPAIMQTTSTGASVAMLAAVRDDVDMLALLVRHGADLHHRIPANRAGLHHVAQLAGAQKCLKLLTYLGAIDKLSPLYKPPSILQLNGSMEQARNATSEDQRESKSSLGRFYHEGSIEDSSGEVAEEEEVVEEEQDEDESGRPGATVEVGPRLATANGVQGHIRQSSCAISVGVLSQFQYDSLLPFEQESLDWLAQKVGPAMVKGLVTSAEEKVAAKSQRTLILDAKKAEAAGLTLKALTSSWKCKECGAMTNVLRASSSCSRCACDGGKDLNEKWAHVSDCLRLCGVLARKTDEAIESGVPIPGLAEGDAFDGTDATKVGYDAAMAILELSQHDAGMHRSSEVAGSDVATHEGAMSAAGSETDVCETLRVLARHLAVSVRAMEKILKEGTGKQADTLESTAQDHNGGLSYADALQAALHMSASSLMGAFGYGKGTSDASASPGAALEAQDPGDADADADTMDQSRRKRHRVAESHVDRMYQELIGSIPAAAMLIEVADQVSGSASAASLSSLQTQLLRGAKAAQLASTLGLSLDDGDLLLRAQKWDVERAVSGFMLDPVMAAEGAKLSSAGRAHAESYHAGSSGSSGCRGEASKAFVGETPSQEEYDSEFMCEVCFAMVPLDETSAPACGHRFCNGCWSEHFSSMVKTGPQCILTGSCLQHECGTGCPESLWRRSASPDDYRRFMHFMLISFVNQQRGMRFCEAEPIDPGAIDTATGDEVEVADVEDDTGPVDPIVAPSAQRQSPGAGAGNAPSIDGADDESAASLDPAERGSGGNLHLQRLANGTNACSRVLVPSWEQESGTVHCACSRSTCTWCGEAAHSPATCDEWAMWLQAQNQTSEAASLDMMMKQYKRCPNCKVFIDKRGGCKHMRCSECGYEYCDLCKRKWDGYSHVCPVGTGGGLMPKSWNKGEVSADEQETIEQLKVDLRSRLRAGPQFEGVSRATGAFSDMSDDAKQQADHMQSVLLKLEKVIGVSITSEMQVSDQASDESGPKSIATGTGYKYGAHLQRWRRGHARDTGGMWQRKSKQYIAASMELAAMKPIPIAIRGGAAAGGGGGREGDATQTAASREANSESASGSETNPTAGVGSSGSSLHLRQQSTSLYSTGITVFNRSPVLRADANPKLCAEGSLLSGMCTQVALGQRVIRQPCFVVIPPGLSDVEHDRFGPRVRTLGEPFLACASCAVRRAGFVGSLGVTFAGYYSFACKHGGSPRWGTIGDIGSSLLIPSQGKTYHSILPELVKRYALAPTDDNGAFSGSRSSLSRLARSRPALAGSTAAGVAAGDKTTGDRERKLTAGSGSSNRLPSMYGGLNALRWQLRAWRAIEQSCQRLRFAVISTLLTPELGEQDLQSAKVRFVADAARQLHSRACLSAQESVQAAREIDLADCLLGTKDNPDAATGLSRVPAKLDREAVEALDKLLVPSKDLMQAVRSVEMLLQGF